MITYDDLRKAAALEPGRGVIRIITSYEPAGGADARVFPPTYPTSGPNDALPYVIEPRNRNGAEVTAVELDSVPSEANRVEEALLRALRGGRLAAPLMSIEHDAITLHSLELPHRYGDAYLRDSTVDGTPFDRSDLGKRILAASATDATALFAHDPGSLVFGAWNSHRKGRQTRFPRVYGSEIVGWNPQVGLRKAGRMDPVNLQGAVDGTGDEWNYVRAAEKAADRKGKVRLSEIGHGNIAPSATHGGVTITSATRFATLSFAALDRLSFGDAPHDAQLAARACLAAYALAGDRLAFGGDSLWLRSGCELTPTDETIAWVGRGGVSEPIELSVDEALTLYAEARERAESAGLAMHLDQIHLVPNKALTEAIDFSLTRADAAASE